MAKEQGGCELHACKKIVSATAGQNVLNYT